MSFPRQAPPSSTTILRTCLWRRAPESGSGVFSAISGLREPTDDPVGPVLRDDRDPADAPVRKAAPVGRQRMVAPNEVQDLSLIHISEPTRLGMISYAVFCL